MTIDSESLQSPDTLRALQHENADLSDENRDLREELLRLRNAIRALKDLQDSLSEITPDSDPHALVDRILSLGLEAVDSENGSLLLLDEETNELVFVSVQGPLQEALDGFRLAPGEGIAGWVVANKKPLLVPDVRHESRWSPTVDQTTGFRTTSLICVPLISQGQVRGALEVVNTHSGDFFNEEDLDVMLLFARLAVQALIQAEPPA
jgi:sigma-B regulation protein RsbU (phosphoserine phosphatase)